MRWSRAAALAPPAAAAQRRRNAGRAGRRRDARSRRRVARAAHAGAVTGRGLRAAAGQAAGASPRRSSRRPPPANARTADGERRHVRSSPLARRLASERGLDLVAGARLGPGGRIIKRDIEAAAAAPAAAAGAARRAHDGRAAQGDFEDIPLTQIRKTIAKRLAESIGPIPTFYLTAEFDLTRVTEMRAAMVEMGDEFKVSINDILIKAVATALAQHPEVNAHWLGDKIRQHNRVHLGMAVATHDGLIVPVIFDADQKRMSEISREARELAKKARERKLKPEEYTGSTFSISNLGMFGIDQFTAIINPPEVAILAIGASEDVVVPRWRRHRRAEAHARHDELRSPRRRRRGRRGVPADAATA